MLSNICSAVTKSTVGSLGKYDVLITVQRLHALEIVAKNTNSNVERQIQQKMTTNDDLKLIMEGLGRKIDTITATTERLESRIEEVSTTISADLHALDTRLTKHVDDLRRNIASQSRTINGHNEVHTREINALKERVKKQEDLLEEKDSELHKSNDRMDYLQKKVVDLEMSNHSGLQHTRGWNLEIDGIPVNIGDEPLQLENAAIKLFHAINVAITPDDIDTIHRLPSKFEPKPVIVRLKSRKHVRLIHENKSKLKDLASLNVDIISLLESSKIYIKPSLCPYYKLLAYNCRVLKRHNVIEKVLTGNDGKVTIKISDGDFVKVTHESMLKSRFPRFEYFKFDFDDNV